MSWMPPLHDLLSPITGDDGSQIEQIQLKPLFYAAQKEALDRAGDDEDDQFFELALLATGLSVKELDQLKRPDYVSIAQYVHEMSTRPASYFLDQVEDAEKSADPDQVQLLQPLAVTGRTVTSLTPGNARAARHQGDEETENGQGTRRVHHRPLHRPDDPRSGPD